MLTNDQWWATLSEERKSQIRGWLDPNSEEHLRREAAKHPDQLSLLDEVDA